MWCGELECELKLKEEADVSSRCMPFGMEPIGNKCVCCGREAKKLVYWGKAY
jgi:prolyl-tRNA synthetase